MNSSFFDEKEDYGSLLKNEKCKSFLGPDYALVSAKYNQLRPEAVIKRKNRGSITEILVFLGSMDPDNYSGIAIEAIQSFKWPVSIEVNCILSANSPSLGLIKEQIERMELDYINPLFLKDNK